MRNTTLKISILTFASIIAVAFNAKAELDPNMEAAVACSTAECMFRGNPTTQDNLGGVQRVTLPGGAHMYNVNRYQDNPDQVVDRAAQTQFAPIGELQSNTVVKGAGTETTSVGTGFLVSPCYIMTAAHVVYGDDLTPIPGKDYSMKFRAGSSQTAAFAGNTVATPVISGDRDMLGRNDWALMKLSSCIGKRPEFGWFEPSKAEAKSLVGKTVVAAGYAADRKRGELSIGAGTITAVESRSGMLKFSGSFAPGESGGPVLTQENGVIKVTGINLQEMGAGQHGATFAGYSSDHANLIQDITKILNAADIKPILDDDKAAFGQPNPATPRLSRPLAPSQMASI